MKVIVCISFLILFILYITLYIVPVHAEDIIQGQYCYTYGDKESLVEAKQLVRTLAVRNAIESYRIFINSTTNVTNFTLTNDIVQMISAGYMKNIITMSQSVEGRMVCEKIQATVSAHAIEEAIKREVQKRAERIEEQGIDNNGIIKILNIRSVTTEYAYSSNYDVIAVTVKALKELPGFYDEDNADSIGQWIFIDYYDKDGNAIGGNRLMVISMFPNEIKTANFQRTPSGTSYYKVWLKKPSEITRPVKNKSSLKPSKK